MILYDYVNLEITNRYSIASGKKGGKPTKKERKVGSITLDGLIESKKLEKLVENTLDIFERDGVSVNEVVLTAKTTDEFI